MLQTPENLALITRYLNHPTDPGLQAEINEFRSIPENDAYFIEVTNIWEKSAAAARLEGIDDSVSIDKLKGKLLKPTSLKKTTISWITGVAASFLVIALGYWAFTKQTKTAYVIKTTAKNQIDSVKLVDGSVVILAENTEVRYPLAFDSPTREIALIKGKAFFKIQKDASHPFKVVLNQSNVIVLGTSFNINISNTRIDVGVKTGRVMFSPYTNSTTSILSAGQALSYNISKKELVMKSAENADSWLTKELVFVDAPLEEVCKQLTNYYGVDIKLETDKPQVKKLNARFKDQTLDDILAVLNETYNIKINKINNQIHLITP